MKNHYNHLIIIFLFIGVILILGENSDNCCAITKLTFVSWFTYQFVRVKLDALNLVQVKSTTDMVYKKRKDVFSLDSIGLPLH